MQLPLGRVVVHPGRRRPPRRLMGGWGIVVAEESENQKPRRRIWVQHVAVEADRLQMQVRAASERRLNKQQEAIAGGVSRLIRNARAAALREDPVPRRWTNWWRGTLVEAAYLNLHTARAEIVDLYDENELRAEIPTAVARAQASLHRDDPRRIAAEQVLQSEDLQPDRVRPILRRLIGDSYQKADLEHAQLRSFRNIVLLSALSMFVLVVSTIAVVSWQPHWMPLCFPVEGGQVCPTSSGPTGPRAADIIMVALLGALGGALTASLSIRNLKGTSTPYDVPVALAMLKVPLGAFTAILALVAIRGNFVPGLSNLDSQEQILAYALAFGFAQQAFSRLLDRRAQTLLEGLPGGTATEPAPTVPAAPTAPAEPAKPGEPPKTVAEVEEGVPGETPELIPAGVLPEDFDVISVPDETEDQAEAGEDHEGEPAQTPEELPIAEELPDQDDAEYFEDGQAEEDAGSDAPDGVEYPTTETER
jgi:hypothetical protein